MQPVADRPTPVALARLDAGALIREARTLAGLTQSQLAARVRTKQSVISRWERGVEEPRLETLARLLRACGFEADVTYRRHDDVDRGQIIEHLNMSPAQRIRSLENVAAFVAAARPAELVDA
jgi:transcriptional regulator with XRE-family HTH domain